MAINICLAATFIFSLAFVQTGQAQEVNMVYQWTGVLDFVGGQNCGPEDSIVTRLDGAGVHWEAKVNADATPVSANGTADVFEGNVSLRLVNADDLSGTYFPTSPTIVEYSGAVGNDLFLFSYGTNFPIPDGDTAWEIRLGGLPFPHGFTGASSPDNTPTAFRFSDILTGYAMYWNVSQSGTVRCDFQVTGGNISGVVNELFINGFEATE